MDGLLEIGSQMLGATQDRLGRTAENVANIGTPGYKSQLSFNDVADFSVGGGEPAQMSLPSTFRPGAGSLKSTGNPLDLALAGGGMFKVGSGDSSRYTRAGQFQLAEDGRVVTTQGLALQQVGGGDLVLEHSQVEILADGTVLHRGLPVGQIAVFGDDMTSFRSAAGGTLFVAADETAVPLRRDAEVRQGMLEGSNVVLADEMLGMMEAVRLAETGSRIVQVYDTLLGQAVSTFGRGRG